MSDSELEIYELGSGRPDGEALPTARSRGWHALDRRTLAGAALVAAGAAGSVVAPFTRFVGVRETFRPDGTITTSVFRSDTDGWGRVHDYTSSGVVTSAVHEIRYGIGTCACAALLFLSIALLPRRRRAALALAVVATSGLAGVVGAQGLGMAAKLSQLRSLAGGSPAGTESVQTAVGPCLWIGLAAVLCAGAGTVLLISRTAGIAVGRRRPGIRRGSPKGS
jgi:hypothetical protein